MEVQSIKEDKIIIDNIIEDDNCTKEDQSIQDKSSEKNMTIIEVECTPSTDPIVEQNKQNLRTNTLTTLGMRIFHIYVSYRKFYWYTKSPDKFPKNINKTIYKIIF